MDCFIAQKLSSLDIMIYTNSDVVFCRVHTVRLPNIVPDVGDAREDDTRQLCRPLSVSVSAGAVGATRKYPASSQAAQGVRGEGWRTSLR